jgi:NTP pyrophosphatase (non-canonical NTP hydrolase)
VVNPSGDNVNLTKKFDKRQRERVGVVDVFKAVFTSTLNLYKRFDLTPVPENTTRKLNEEVYEFLKAVDKATAVFEVDRLLDERNIVTSRAKYDAYVEAVGAHYRELHAQIAEEGADVIITVVGVLIAMGITPEQARKALAAKLAKNDAKTPDTHQVIKGLIVKKEDVA